MQLKHGQELLENRILLFLHIREWSVHNLEESNCNKQNRLIKRIIYFDKTYAKNIVCYEYVYHFLF